MGTSGLGPWLVAVIGGAALGVVGTVLTIGIAVASRRISPSGPQLDLVTGLPTAERLHADLTAAVADPDRGSQKMVCVYLLEGLRQYNDAYGEACGDALLAWLARKLIDAVGADATAYRLRAASFALLIRDGAAHGNAVRHAGAGALHEVGEGFMISCTVGSALIPQEAQSAKPSLDLAARRAHAARSTDRVAVKLHPPHEPMDATRPVHPRYDIATLATQIGRRMAMPERQLDDLAAAAHLRDVGNMAMPSPVLARAGELPEHEWEFIRLHTIVGERLLATNFGMELVGKIVRSSHERWDGSGYPDGLAGEQIPLGSRVVFVCSAFQDMASERPYRAPLPESDALIELERGAGAQFDPAVVRAFLEEFSSSRSPADDRPDLSRRPILRVLVADDDAASRFLLQRAIEAAGHDCVAVQDGTDAWSAFQEHDPSLVIADSRLPGLASAEFFRRVRRTSSGACAYFAVLVAPEDADQVREGALRAADDFLTKPLDQQHVDALMRSAEQFHSVQSDPY